MALEGSCICNGANQCPGCNESEAEKLRQAMAELDARYAVPPCLDCGATSLDDAQGKCGGGNYNDDCHGSRLWPE